MADNEFQLVPVEKITWLEQERKHFDPEAMAGLIQSVKTFGVIEPIGVIRDGVGFKGLWGQRRFLASKSAGLPTIPSLIQAKPRSEAEAIELRLTENELREKLNPIELAAGLARLMKESGRSAGDVAQRLGMSASNVSRALRLLELSPELQQQVSVGKITAASAYELALVPDATRRQELAALAAEGKLTRDALSGARKKAKRAASPSPAGPSRALVKLGVGNSITISSTGLTLETCVDLVEQLLAKLRDARKREWSLNSFLKVQDDLSRQPAAKE